MSSCRGSRDYYTNILALKPKCQSSANEKSDASRQHLFENSLRPADLGSEMDFVPKEILSERLAVLMPIAAGILKDLFSLASESCVSKTKVGFRGTSRHFNSMRKTFLQGPRPFSPAKCHH